MFVFANILYVGLFLREDSLAVQMPTTFRTTERSVLPDEFFPAISLYNVWVSCLYPFLVSFSHIVRILTRTIFFY